MLGAADAFARERDDSARRGAASRRHSAPTKIVDL